MKEGLMYSSLTRRLVGVAVAFAALAFAVSAFAQTGGLTGKCTGEDGKPLVGYTIQVERQEMKWSSHTKTNKKGEYVYIGLAPGNYKITLLDPSGKQVFNVTQRVGMGDPTEVDFDMAKEKANPTNSRWPTLKRRRKSKSSKGSEAVYRFKADLRPSHAPL